MKRKQPEPPFAGPPGRFSGPPPPGPGYGGPPPPGPGYGPGPDYYEPGFDPHYPPQGPPGRFPPNKRGAPNAPGFGGPPPGPFPPGPGGPPPGPGRRDGPPPGPGPRGGPGKGGRPAFQLDLPPEPNILQEVLVHRRLVGKIIGPGGETAAQIRKGARCFLHVRKETRPDDTQVVEVSGTAMQVRAGVSKVVESVQEDAGSDPKLQPKVSPHAVTYFDVMPEMIGYILGSKGATVKMLRQKTQTEIQVTDAAPESGLQAITIRGAPDRVQDAYIQIRSMLEKYDPRRGKGPPPGLLSSGPPAVPPGGPPGPHMPPGPGYDRPPPGGDYPPPGGHHYDYDDPRGDPYYHGPPGGPGDRGYGPPHQDSHGPGHGHPYPLDGPDYGPRDGYGRDRGSPGRGGDPYGHSRMGPSDPRQQGPPVGAPDMGGRSAAVAPQGHVPAPVATGPGGAVPAGTPQFLVLHPDGTYRPAQIILNVPPGGAAGAQGAAQPNSAAGTAALSQLLGQVGSAVAQPAQAAAQPAAGGYYSQAPAAGQTAAAQPQYGSYASQAPAQVQQPAAAAYPGAQPANAYGQQPQSQYAGQQYGAQYTTQQPAAYSYDTAATATTGTAPATTAAAASTAAGSAAGAASSGLTLQQLQQYYNSYAQMYQQAAQQQQMMTSQQGGGAGGAPNAS